MELATQLVRLKNGDIPSLRESVAEAWGYDYDYMFANRGKADSTGRFATNAVALKAVHERCLELAAGAVEGKSPEELWPDLAGPAARALTFLADIALPRVAQTTDEIKSVLHALCGGYVGPGNSGCPTRGRVDVLPTGCNFFSVDPYKLPSPTAWRVGKDLWATTWWTGTVRRPGDRRTPWAWLSGAAPTCAPRASALPRPCI